MVRPESSAFNEFNFKRKHADGKLIGGICKKCGEARTNTSRERLESHYNICSVQNTEGTSEQTPSDQEIDVNDPSTPKARAGPSSGFRNPCATPDNESSALDSRKRKTPCRMVTNKGRQIEEFFDKCTEDQAKVLKKKMLMWAIATDLELEKVGHTSFIKFLDSMRPRFCQEHYAGPDDLLSLVPELYDDVFSKMQKVIGDNCVISLTIDESTDSCIAVAAGCGFVQMTSYPKNEETGLPVISNEFISSAVSIIKHF